MQNTSQPDGPGKSRENILQRHKKICCPKTLTLCNVAYYHYFAIAPLAPYIFRKLKEGLLPIVLAVMLLLSACVTPPQPTTNETEGTTVPQIQIHPDLEKCTVPTENVEGAYYYKCIGNRKLRIEYLPPLNQVYEKASVVLMISGARDNVCLYPNEEIRHQASPIYFLEGSKVPCKIFMGKMDNVVSPISIEKFKEACDAAGVPCELVWFEHAGHSYESMDDETVLPRFSVQKSKLVDFAKQCVEAAQS